ncbi:MAG: response regulator [Alphaproteobacteria bacterium]|nr:response regulator [Alphaproteobacteria bacterium]
MRANIMRAPNVAMFGEVFERASEAYFIVDDQLDIFCANRATLKLLRTTIDAQYPEFSEPAKMRRALAQASSTGEWVVLRIMLAGADKTHVFEARLRRLRDEPGAARYIVSLSKDSADKEAFKALRQEVIHAHARSAAIELTKKRLSNVIAATEAGCWEWDVKSGDIWVNDHWRQMLGLEQDEDDTYSIQQWRRLCHTDDVVKGWAHIKACLRGRMQTRILEVRVRHKKGHWVWVAINSRIVEQHADGRPAVIAGTQVDITQRMAHERALEEKSLQAEAANIAKSQFLATMSHELRTPMNGVLGMLEVVLKTPLTAQQHEYIDVARSSAQSLLRVLNDVLDFSKLEAGAVTIENVPYSPSKVIDDVTALLRPKAEEKGLQLKIEKNSNIPGMLDGDGVRLRQVLINLIGNAIKFTDRGHVEVSAGLGKTRSSDQLMITVRDTGIGISEAAGPKLFKHFAQADSSMSRRFGGTGLGLVISKQIVELMGGEIGVRSEEGKGSTFWFTVPAQIVASGDAGEAVLSDEEAAAEGAPVARSMRILAADDHPVNQQVLKLFLASLGHETVMVENGQLAVEAMDSHSFDAIIMDIEMPVMDGIAATKAIRARASVDRDIPIIAVTAHALSGDREKYLDAGMNDYVSKPFNQEELQAALARVVEGGAYVQADAAIESDESAPIKMSAG